MKSIFRACIIAALALAATASVQAAPSNQFVSADPYTGVAKVYSVSNVRMITATPSSFVLQYNDANDSRAFRDSNYTQLTQLLANAPALKAFRQIGTSGVYINPDQVREFRCQNAPNYVEATDSGDWMQVIWSPPGGFIVADKGCATVNAIKANAN